MKENKTKQNNNNKNSKIPLKSIQIWSEDLLFSQITISNDQMEEVIFSTGGLIFAATGRGQ